MPVLLGFAILLGVVHARGADTLEPYALGPSDFEVYSGVEGISTDAEKRVHFAEYALGYGLTDELSAYAGGAVFADRYLSQASNSCGLGGYGRLIDTYHFDWDLGLEVGSAALAMTYGAFTELNLDAADDLALAGAYLRLGTEIAGDSSASGGTERRATRLAASGLLGGYVTLTEAQQVLVEFDADRALRPSASASVELGSARLGYNLMLTDSVELVSEVSADMPQSGEVWAFGGFTGILATLEP